MAVQLTTSFADLIDPLCQEYYYYRHAQTESKWPLFFREKDAPALSFQVNGVTNFSRFESRSEGNDFAALNQYEQDATTITVAKYTGEFEVTEEMILGAQKLRMVDDIKQKIAYLADAYSQEADYLAFSILNNGFTDTIANGQALFSASHPCKGGGTRDNLHGTDLSTSNLALGITAMRTYPDDHGDYRIWNPKYLVVPEASRVTALQAIGSQYISDSLAADNLDPVVKDLVVISSPWIDMVDADSWFLVCEGEYSPLVWYWFEKSKLFSEMDKKRNIVYNDRFYCAQEALVDFGILGSTGAG